MGEVELGKTFHTNLNRPKRNILKLQYLLNQPKVN